MNSMTFRTTFSNFFFATILFLILFFIKTIPFKLELMIILFFNTGCLLAFRIECNRDLYKKILLFECSVQTAFCVTKILSGSRIYNIDVVEWVLIAVQVVMCGVFLRYGFYGKDEVWSVRDDDDLFKERKYDLERLLLMVSKVSILGVNADWGVGKSFLIDALCEEKEIKEQYHVVKVDLLVTRLGDLQKNLVGELNAVLKQNGIYSKSAHVLTKLFSTNKYLSMGGSFFIRDEESVSQALKGLNKDLFKVKKDILIIYDDIDRIGDVKTIKQIFAIAESFSSGSEKIKNMFLYSEQNLSKVDSVFSHEYLEKYIPYSITLTPVSIRSMVKYFWGRLQMDNANIDQKEILNLVSLERYNYSVNNYFSVGFFVNLEEFKVPARRVRKFLEEIKIYAQTGLYNSKDKKKILYKALYLKHFLYQLYEKIEIGESLMETFSFRDGDKSYTMNELVREMKDNSKKERKQRLDKLLESEENAQSMMIVSVFPYNYMDKEKDFFEEDVKMRRELLANESEYRLRVREENERIDRVIWNVVANGASELTNPEKFLREISERVLDKKGHERDVAWQQFLEDTYYENLYKDNSTLFRFGIEPYIDVFKAFRMAGATDRQWLEWVDFYMEKVSSDGITVKLVENLAYCYIRSKELYIEILKKFNSLKVRGNLCGKKGWHRFLKNYIEPVELLGYCHYSLFDPHVVGDMIDLYENDGRLGEYFVELDSYLEKEEENLKSDREKMELKVIREFLEQCKKVSDCTSKVYM